MFSDDSHQYLHNVGAAEGEPWLQRGEKPEKVSTIVSTRSLCPVANSSWTKSMAQVLGRGFNESAKSRTA
jgi:hypothetical protein